MSHPLLSKRDRFHYFIYWTSPSFLFCFNRFLSLFTHNTARHRFYLLAAFRLQHLYISKYHFSGLSTGHILIYFRYTVILFLCAIFYFTGNSSIVYVVKSSYLRHLYRTNLTTKPLLVKRQRLIFILVMGKWNNYINLLRYHPLLYF